MRTRVLLPFSALCIGLPVMVFVLPRLLAPKPVADSIGEFAQWEPTAAQIRQTVGARSLGSYADERHRQFAKMFQYRFRNNGKAVGISFASDHRIKAKFAASIPRWDMASVSLDLHREAQDVFGRDFEVDIFETYISMVPVKLGELRTMPDGAVNVLFDPRFSRERNDAGAQHMRFLRTVLFSRPTVPKSLPNPMSWLSSSEIVSRPAMSESRPMILRASALSVAATR